MPMSERMSAVDTTWLRMDRPANPMIIIGVLILAGPVDAQKVERTLARRLLVFRRFRQRPEIGLTGTWWSEDTSFDLSRHIRHARLPGAQGKAELEQFVAELASRPLDDRHPLWQFHIVEGFEGGAALVMRIHHAIGDGMALMGVLLRLTDERPHLRRRTAPESDESEGFLAPVARALGWGLRTSGEVLRGSLKLVSDPLKGIDYALGSADLARDGTGIAAELAHLALMPSDSPTRFKGTPGGEKRVAWTNPLALPEVKVVGQVLGCSVNDMLLAAVAGALHGYLKDKGDATAGVEVRALVPVNLRPPDDAALGNHFGVVAIELPVGLDSPLARLNEVHRRMEALKQSYEPAVTLGLLTALGHAPKLVQDRIFDLLLSRATAVMTNMPGPQQPLHLAGSEIRQMMFWVPQSGDIGMGVSILSFNGQVQFGLITDAALVPDPQAIIAKFKPEFEQLLYFVLLEPWGPPPEAGSRRRPRARRARERKRPAARPAT
jgi:diacylglycerol O-acyltransferase / wax synthase